MKKRFEPCPEFFVIKNTVDSVEVVNCVCSACNSDVMLVCGELDDILYCPMCGEGISMEYVDSEKDLDFDSMIIRRK